MVSRETPSATPDSARRVFPAERLPLAEAYAALLAGAGTVRGLIGPREVPRLWERHLLNCAAVGEEIPPNATVADLGSGAGLPGIVLSIVRPDLRVTLVEPLLRRTTFLDEVVTELGLTGVEVLRARAEDLRGTRRFDIVTSRALAPLERLLGWSMPLVAPEGALLAMKGSSVTDEIETARSAWERLGCAEPTVVLAGVDVLESPTTLLRVAWADPEQVGCDPARAAGTAGRPGSRKLARERRRR